VAPRAAPQDATATSAGPRIARPASDAARGRAGVLKPPTR
jgi:hypothetical protein